jgi:hypothetical protein
MIYSLISGNIFRKPEERTSQAGKFYVSATIKVANGTASQFVRVLFFDGLASETRHVRADGTTIVKHEPPVRKYFLDYHDEDGCVCGMWDGLSYADAIAAAEEWRRDGIVIDDRVSDEGGAA